MVTTSKGEEGDQSQTRRNEETKRNSPSLISNSHQSTTLTAVTSTWTTATGSNVASELLIENRKSSSSRQGEEKPLVKSYPNGKVQGNKNEHRLGAHHVDAKTAWMDTSKPVNKHFDSMSYLNGRTNLDEVIELQTLY